MAEEEQNIFNAIKLTDLGLFNTSSPDRTGPMLTKERQFTGGGAINMSIPFNLEQYQGNWFQNIPQQNIQLGATPYSMVTEPVPFQEGMGAAGKNAAIAMAALPAFGFGAGAATSTLAPVFGTGYAGQLAAFTGGALASAPVAMGADALLQKTPLAYNQNVRAADAESYAQTAAIGLAMRPTMSPNLSTMGAAATLGGIQSVVGSGLAQQAGAYPGTPTEQLGEVIGGVAGGAAVGALKPTQMGESLMGPAFQYGAGNALTSRIVRNTYFPEGKILPLSDSTEVGIPVRAGGDGAPQFSDVTIVNNAFGRGAIDIPGIGKVDLSQGNTGIGLDGRTGAVGDATFYNPSTGAGAVVTQRPDGSMRVTVYSNLGGAAKKAAGPLADKPNFFQYEVAPRVNIPEAGPTLPGSEQPQPTSYGEPAQTGPVLPGAGESAVPKPVGQVLPRPERLTLETPRGPVYPNDARIAEWDAQYGKTHNPDGTPKSQAQLEAEARAAQPQPQQAPTAEQQPQPTRPVAPEPAPSPVAEAVSTPKPAPSEPPRPTVEPATGTATATAERPQVEFPKPPEPTRPPAEQQQTAGPEAAKPEPPKPSAPEVPKQPPITGTSPTAAIPPVTDKASREQVLRGEKGIDETDIETEQGFTDKERARAFANRRRYLLETDPAQLTDKDKKDRASLVSSTQPTVPASNANYTGPEIPEFVRNSIREGKDMKDVLANASPEQRAEIKNWAEEYKIWLQSLQSPDITTDAGKAAAATQVQSEQESLADAGRSIKDADRQIASEIANGAKIVDISVDDFHNAATSYEKYSDVWLNSPTTRKKIKLERPDGTTVEYTVKGPIFSNALIRDGGKIISDDPFGMMDAGESGVVGAPAARVFTPSGAEVLEKNEARKPDARPKAEEKPIEVTSLPQKAEEKPIEVTSLPKEEAAAPAAQEPAAGEPAAQPEPATQPEPQAAQSEAEAKVEDAVDLVIDEVERVVDVSGAKSGKAVLDKVIQTAEELLSDAQERAGFNEITVNKDGNIYADNRWVGDIDGMMITLSNEYAYITGGEPINLNDKGQYYRGSLTPSQIKELAIQRISSALARNAAFRKDNPRRPAQYTIKIPGDGTFKLESSPAAIARFIKRLKQEGSSIWKSIPGYKPVYGREETPTAAPSEAEAKLDEKLEEADDKEKELQDTVEEKIGDGGINQEDSWKAEKEQKQNNEPSSVETVYNQKPSPEAVTKKEKSYISGDSNIGGKTGDAFTGRGRVSPKSEFPPEIQKLIEDYLSEGAKDLRNGAYPAFFNNSNISGGKSNWISDAHRIADGNFVIYEVNPVGNQALGNAANRTARLFKRIVNPSGQIIVPNTEVGQVGTWSGFESSSGFRVAALFHAMMGAAQDYLNTKNTSVKEAPDIAGAKPLSGIVDSALKDYEDNDMAPKGLRKQMERFEGMVDGNGLNSMIIRFMSDPSNKVLAGDTMAALQRVGGLSESAAKALLTDISVAQGGGELMLNFSIDISPESDELYPEAYAGKMRRELDQLIEWYERGSLPIVFEVGKHDPKTGLEMPDTVQKKDANGKPMVKKDGSPWMVPNPDKWTVKYLDIASEETFHIIDAEDGRTLFKPFAHQIRGINAAITRFLNASPRQQNGVPSAFLNMDAPGVGKTIQMLGTAKLYHDIFKKKSKDPNDPYYGKPYKVLIVSQNRNILVQAFGNDAKMMGIDLAGSFGNASVDDKETIDVSPFVPKKTVATEDGGKAIDGDESWIDFATYNDIKPSDKEIPQFNKDGTPVMVDVIKMDPDDKSQPLRVNGEIQYELDENGNRKQQQLVKRELSGPPKKGAGEWGLVIFDECHNMKNVDSARSQAGWDLFVRTQHLMLATGTPIDKPHLLGYFFALVMDMPLESIAAQLGMSVKRVSNKKVRKTSGFDIASSRDTLTTEAWAKLSPEEQAIRFAKCVEAIRRLRDAAGQDGKLIRRGKPFFGTFDNWLDVTGSMPETTRNMIIKITQWWYNEIELASQSPEGVTKIRNMIGQKLMELKRATALAKIGVPGTMFNPHEKDADGNIIKEAQPYGAARILLDEISKGRKVVIAIDTTNEAGEEDTDSVSRLRGLGPPGATKQNKKAVPYDSEFKVLSEWLSSLGIKYGIITGKSKTTERAAFIKKFQENSDELQVIIMTPQSGGTGLSLDDRHGYSMKSPGKQKKFTQASLKSTGEYAYPEASMGGRKVGDLSYETVLDIVRGFSTGKNRGKLTQAALDAMKDDKASSLSKQQMEILQKTGEVITGQIFRGVTKKMIREYLDKYGVKGGIGKLIEDRFKEIYDSGKIVIRSAGVALLLHTRNKYVEALNDAFYSRLKDLQGNPEEQARIYKKYGRTFYSTGSRPRTFIVVSAPWGGDVLEQMMGRTDRMTTTTPSRLIFLTSGLSEGDERLINLIRAKIETLHAMTETGDDLAAQIGGSLKTDESRQRASGFGSSMPAEAAKTLAISKINTKINQKNLVLKNAQDKLSQISEEDEKNDPSAKRKAQRYRLSIKKTKEAIDALQKTKKEIEEGKLDPKQYLSEEGSGSDNELSEAEESQAGGETEGPPEEDPEAGLNINLNIIRDSAWSGGDKWKEVPSLAGVSKSRSKTAKIISNLYGIQSRIAPESASVVHTEAVQKVMDDMLRPFLAAYSQGQMTKRRFSAIRGFARDVAWRLTEYVFHSQYVTDENQLAKVMSQGFLGAISQAGKEMITLIVSNKAVQNYSQRAFDPDATSRMKRYMASHAIYTTFHEVGHALLSFIPPEMLESMYEELERARAAYFDSMSKDDVRRFWVLPKGDWHMSGGMENIDFKIRESMKKTAFPGLIGDIEKKLPERKIKGNYGSVPTGSKAITSKKGVVGVGQLILEMIKPIFAGVSNSFTGTRGQLLWEYANSDQMTHGGIGQEGQLSFRKAAGSRYTDKEKLSIFLAVNQLSNVLANLDSPLNKGSSVVHRNIRNILTTLLKGNTRSQAVIEIPEDGISHEIADKIDSNQDFIEELLSAVKSSYGTYEVDDDGNLTATFVLDGGKASSTSFVKKNLIGSKSSISGLSDIPKNFAKLVRVKIPKAATAFEKGIAQTVIQNQEINDALSDTVRGIKARSAIARGESSNLDISEAEEFINKLKAVNYVTAIVYSATNEKEMINRVARLRSYADEDARAEDMATFETRPYRLMDLDEWMAENAAAFARDYYLLNNFSEESSMHGELVASLFVHAGQAGNATITRDIISRLISGEINPENKDYFQGTDVFMKDYFKRKSSSSAPGNQQSGSTSPPEEGFQINLNIQDENNSVSNNKDIFKAEWQRVIKKWRDNLRDLIRDTEEQITPRMINSRIIKKGTELPRDPKALEGKGADYYLEHLYGVLIGQVEQIAKKTGNMHVMSLAARLYNNPDSGATVRVGFTEDYERFKNKWFNLLQSIIQEELGEIIDKAEDVNDRTLVRRKISQVSNVDETARNLSLAYLESRSLEFNKVGMIQSAFSGALYDYNAFTWGSASNIQNLKLSQLKNLVTDADIKELGKLFSKYNIKAHPYSWLRLTKNGISEIKIVHNGISVAEIIVNAIDELRSKMVENLLQDARDFINGKQNQFSSLRLGREFDYRLGSVMGDGTVDKLMMDVGRCLALRRGTIAYNERNKTFLPQVVKVADRISNEWVSSFRDWAERIGQDIPNWGSSYRPRVFDSDLIASQRNGQRVAIPRFISAIANAIYADSKAQRVYLPADIGEAIGDFVGINEGSEMYGPGGTMANRLAAEKASDPEMRNIIMEMAKAIDDIEGIDEIDFVLFDPKTDAGKSALQQMIAACSKIGLPSVFTKRIKTILNYYAEKNHFNKVPQKIDNNLPDHDFGKEKGFGFDINIKRIEYSLDDTGKVIGVNSTAQPAIKVKSKASLGMIVSIMTHLYGQKLKQSIESLNGDTSRPDLAMLYGSGFFDYFIENNIFAFKEFKMIKIAYDSLMKSHIRKTRRSESKTITRLAAHRIAVEAAKRIIHKTTGIASSGDGYTDIFGLQGGDLNMPSVLMARQMDTSIADQYLEPFYVNDVRVWGNVYSRSVVRDMMIKHHIPEDFWKSLQASVLSDPNATKYWEDIVFAVRRITESDIEENGMSMFNSFITLLSHRIFMAQTAALQFGEPAVAGAVLRRNNILKGIIDSASTMGSTLNSAMTGAVNTVWSSVAQLISIGQIRPQNAPMMGARTEARAFGYRLAKRVGIVQERFITDLGFSSADKRPLLKKLADETLEKYHYSGNGLSAVTDASRVAVMHTCIVALEQMADDIISRAMAYDVSIGGNPFAPGSLESVIRNNYRFIMNETEQTALRNYGVAPPDACNFLLYCLLFRPLVSAQSTEAKDFLNFNDLNLQRNIKLWELNVYKEDIENVGNFEMYTGDTNSLSQIYQSVLFRLNMRIIQYNTRATEQRSKILVQRLLGRNTAGMLFFLSHFNASLSRNVLLPVAKVAAQTIGMKNKAEEEYYSSKLNPVIEGGNDVFLYNKNKMAGMAVILSSVMAFSLMSATNLGIRELRKNVNKNPAISIVEEKSPAFQVLAAVDAGGLLGTTSLPVNIVTSARYNRDAAQLASGPFFGGVFSLIDAGRELASERNSPNTPTAERAFAKGVYDYALAPATTLTLSVFLPRNDIGDLLNFAATQVSAQKGIREAFVRAFPGSGEAVPITKQRLDVLLKNKSITPAQYQAALRMRMAWEARNPSRKYEDPVHPTKKYGQ